MADSSRRMLQVVSCDAKASGQNKNGQGEWTIYEVAALDANGDPVEQELRSFEAFPPTDKPIEFEVTPFDHPKHGRTYTLSKPGSSPGKRLGPKVDELRERVDELEERVARLESGGSGSPAPAAAGGSDEDIPF